MINYFAPPLGPTTIEALNARGKELTWSINNIDHDPARKADIQKELGNIAFEMWWRHKDGEFEFDYVE